VAARQGHWGLVVSEESPVRLALALTELAGDERMREALGRAAAGLADVAYDGVKVRAAFRAALAGAARALDRGSTPAPLNKPGRPADRAE
jgi:hypothetical protein